MLEMYKNIYYSIKHKFYTNPLPLEFSSIFATNFLSNRIHINLINDIPTYICRNMDPGWNVPRAEWWLTQSVRGHWTSHANQVSVTWVSASTASKRRRTTTGCIVVPRRASARTAVSRSNRSWASPRRRSSRWAAAGARPLITTRRPVSIPKESGRTVSWAFTLPSSFHHHGSIVKLPRKGSFKSSLRKSPRKKKSGESRRKSKEKDKEKEQDKERLWVVKPIPTASVKPVLVFINPKSGGNQGAKLLQKFQWLLNPRQVFDLTQGGPKMGWVYMKGLRAAGARRRIFWNM